MVFVPFLSSTSSKQTPLNRNLTLNQKSPRTQFSDKQVDSEREIFRHRQFRSTLKCDYLRNVILTHVAMPQHCVSVQTIIDIVKCSLAKALTTNSNYYNQFQQRNSLAPLQRFLFYFNLKFMSHAKYCKTSLLFILCQYFSGKECRIAPSPKDVTPHGKWRSRCCTNQNIPFLCDVIFSIDQ